MNIVTTCGCCLTVRGKSVALESDGVCPACHGVQSGSPASSVQFTREPRPPVRMAIVAIRVSRDEQAVVDDLAKKLGLKNRAEVVRKALDLMLAANTS